MSKYVIVDKRTTCGNSVFFWCWDHKGYTCDLRMAGIYTKQEAKTICDGRKTDVMFKYEEVLKLVQHHVDCQDLYRKKKPKYPHTYSHLEKL
ncbi:MAG: hypothetical protein KDD50_15730 [Bdellovibrionales bacterium]|nr:hypothetical protein [Bdellovibrionales bacterium]